jgi:soluble lytic murein transglycosylase
MQRRRYQLRVGKTWAGAGLFIALATALPGSLTTLSHGAAAQPVRTSALAPGTELPRETDLPSLLAPGDAQRYRRVFSLQGSGQWAAADRDIGQLKDKVLIGAVEAQRYLDPRWHAHYHELSRWLARHADEPSAKAIYALALKHRPAGAALPARPVAALLLPRDPRDETSGAPAASAAPAPRKSLTAAERQRADLLQEEIRGFAFADPPRAERALDSAEAKRLLDADTEDELRTVIAEGYLAAGQAEAALALSTTAHGAAYAPAAQWQAGLAAWRLGRLGEARGHFQAVARAQGVSSSATAAAAYWAARIELRSGRPELFTYWLGVAAEHPRTFYGLLARHTLGIDTAFDFDSNPFTENDAQ